MCDIFCMKLMCTRYDTVAEFLKILATAGPRIEHFAYGKVEEAFLLSAVSYLM